MTEDKNTQNLVSSQGQDLQSLKERQQLNEVVMIGIIIVLFVGFIAIVVALGIDIVDSYRSREASYTDLVQIISAQNAKIDRLVQKHK